MQGKLGKIVFPTSATYIAVVHVSKGSGFRIWAYTCSLLARGRVCTNSNHVIILAGKAGEWGLCMQTYEEMLHVGLKADIYTYSSLIQACQCCGSRWKQASSYFQQMKQEGGAPVNRLSCITKHKFGIGTAVTVSCVD